MTQEQRMTIASMAVKKYGYAAQLRQLQEECAELIAATSHYIRQRKAARKELIEEMADVTIMLMQLAPSVNRAGELEAMVDQKLEHLSSRL